MEVEDVPTGRGESKRVMVPCGGIPWYAVPFGRDSIITSLQTLTYNPQIAEGTLRSLAQHQGTRIDQLTEEEPGRIFHELRRGELANLREIPHVPYYGSTDATPLFVILFVETMAWLHGSLVGNELWEDLLPAVMKALHWIDHYGDVDGDGYVESRGGGPLGVRNQGWKDSVDSLQHEDGSYGELPADLVEVQAYVYQAKMGLSALLRRHGDQAMALRLESEAAVLRTRLNQDFWMEQEGFYAQALDAEKRQVKAITSNAGHVLWSGVATPEIAGAVVARLMAPDVFSGWGLRTLSNSSPNYNPMSYHNGSVWPHDNSLIAFGMSNYGFHDEAAEVITSVISAGLRFPGNRLPELFCGFPRDLRLTPVRPHTFVGVVPKPGQLRHHSYFYKPCLGYDRQIKGESRWLLSLTIYSTASACAAYALETRALASPCIFKAEGSRLMESQAMFELIPMLSRLQCDESGIAFPDT